MRRSIIVYVYFATVLCCVSHGEEDRQRLFNNEESRIDFANLLSSLVKLNEQRINVIKKMNHLQDYGTVREVLRSSADLRNHAKRGRKARNLLVVVLSNNQSKATRRHAPFPDPIDPYYDSINQYRNPETRKWYYTQEKFNPHANHQRDQFSRRYNNADNFRMHMYREGFNWHTDKHIPNNEYEFERNDFNGRRQGVFRKDKAVYDNSPYINPKIVKHDDHNIAFNINPPTRHRVSQEVSSSGHDSLSDEYKTTAYLNMTRGMSDVEPGKNYVEPFRDEINEKSLEKHNKKFISKIKKQKFVQQHKTKETTKSILRIGEKFNDKTNNYEFVTSTLSHDVPFTLTFPENTANYNKFSSLKESLRDTTEPETNNKNNLGRQRYVEPKREFAENRFTVTINRHKPMRYPGINREIASTGFTFSDKENKLKRNPRPERDLPGPRLSLIERPDNQKRRPELDRDFSVTGFPMNDKQNTFKKYPEPYKGYPTPGLAIIEKHNRLKTIPNQLVPQLDSVLPDLETMKKPDNYNNMFEHTGLPEEISITGFAMVGDPEKFKSKPPDLEVDNDFVLSAMNIDEKFNQFDAQKMQTEPNKDFAPPDIVFNNKQDILKSLQERLPSISPTENFLDLQAELKKKEQLREGRSLFPDKNKNKMFTGDTMKFDKPNILKDKQEADDNLSKANLDFVDTGEEFGNKVGFHNYQPNKDALRKNSGSKNSWAKCFGKKSYKKCRKACNNAYKSVCKRLKCTSRSKKDLKKECERSCKDTFGYSSDRKKRDDSSSGDSSY